MRGERGRRQGRGDDLRLRAAFHQRLAEEIVHDAVPAYSWPLPSVPTRLTAATYARFSIARAGSRLRHA
jgi:hypothetical protein